MTAPLDLVALAAEQGTDGLIVFSAGGKVRYANAAAARQFWLDSAADFTLLPPHDLIRRFQLLDGEGRPLPPGRFPDRVARATGETQEALVQVLNPATGASRWLYARATPLRDAGGEIGHVSLGCTDVTTRMRERELLDARVAERTAEWELLLEVGRQFTATADLRRSLTQTLEQLRRIMPYNAAAIARLDRGELVTLAHLGPGDSEAVLDLRFPTDLASGAIGEQLDQGKPVILADLQADTPPMARFREDLGAAHARFFGHVRGLLLVTLAYQQRPIGLLAISSATPDHFTPGHARLAGAIASQAAIAIENARLFAQARELAVLAERQRVARDLHDSVAQVFYSIGLHAAVARSALAHDASQTATALEEMRRLSRLGLAEMRALILALRPEVLANEGLIAALNKLAEAFHIRQEWALETDFGPEPDLPQATKEALYRMAQEALNNINKHARAGRATLRLGADPRGYALEIADDGIGFDAAVAHPGRLGLLSMRERVAQIGGMLQIESAVGGGTRLRVVVPAPGR